jgi:histidinol-phosphate aminotransferase
MISGIEFEGQASNVAFSRTFSNIYSLVGLRIGWIYALATVIDAMNQVRGPFNVNAVAIEAGAAAVSDRVHTERAAAHNEESLPKLLEAIRKLGLDVTPSVGNIPFPFLSPMRTEL